MKCSKAKLILSAYANGEVTERERALVEKHLSECSDCRETLEAYRALGKQIGSLRAMPRNTDVRQETMSRISKTSPQKSGTSKWLRPAFISVSALIVVGAALVTWRPWSSLPRSESVIARAETAISSVESYRFSLVSKRTQNGQLSETNLDVEFAAPDRYHITSQTSKANLEIVLIGDSGYFKDGFAPPESARSLADAYSSMLTREATVRQLDYLKNVVKLRDEKVNGVDCSHFRGEYDVEKHIRATMSQVQNGMPPVSEEQIAEQVQQWKDTIGSITVELWIGKEDYLVRRMTTIAAKTEAGASTLEFSDFNGKVVVDAPVDRSGQLLPGWTSTVPDSPNFKADIQTTVNNYDPSNRQVNYAITLVSTSDVALNEVDVQIMAILDKAPLNAVWSSWNNGQRSNGPYTLDPEDVLKYTSTFGYDATAVGAQVMAAILDKSYVEVTYTLPDGQQKVETFHFQAPESIYTLPTVVPSEMARVQMKPDGEYRITEAGVTSASVGAEGEIDGKPCIFEVINKQSTKNPGPPGILVLDTKDPTAPRRVGYISTGGGTKYIMSAVLSGRTLYVCTGDFLWILDVSKPSSPKEIARLLDLRPVSMAISGKYAYADEGNNSIVTLDISDPPRPEQVGSLSLSSSTVMQLHIAADNQLLVDTSQGLYSINTTSPASLSIAWQRSFDSSVETSDGTSPGITYPYYTMGSLIAGDRAYVMLAGQSGSGILVMDISDPANPRQLSFLKLRDSTIGGPAFIEGDRLYALVRKTSGPITLRMNPIMQAIDIADTTHPRQLGYGVLPDPWSVFESYASGSSQSYSLIGGYLYWSLSAEPNQATMEVFALPTW